MRTVWIAAVSVILLTPAPAQAQAPAQSTSQLEKLEKTVRQGDRIQVLDANLAKVEGEFRGLSGANLRLLLKGSIIEIPDTQVYQVRKMRHEPDGLLIGAGIGAVSAMVAVTFGFCASSSEYGDCLRAAGLILGAPSAVAGALIDWGIRHYDTVFERRMSANRRWHVAPLVHPHQRGVVVGISF